VLRLKNVGKKFNSGYRALHNVNLTITTNEFVYITGSSGAGKSTFLNLLSATEQSSHGEINIGQLAYNNLRANQLHLIRSQLGLVPQTPMLISDQSVANNVALPLIIKGKSSREISKKVRAVLEKVGLINKANYLASTLSGGEQQRVAIARAIINKPLYIIADEPTGNLDPSLSLEILNLLVDFHRVGVGIIIATHDVSLLEHFPARQIVIDKGQIAFDSTAREDISCMT
jgi:cell division transport system ATP-binding protein